MDDEQIKALLAGIAAKTEQSVATATRAAQDAAQVKADEKAARETAVKKTADEKAAAAALAAKQGDAAKASHTKADEKVTAMAQKIMKAVRGDLKAKAMAAGLLDADFLSLSAFDLPADTMPGDDSIQAKVDEVRKAKGNLFKASYSGSGKQPPAAGDNASKKDIPDDWNLYDTGIDLRAGLVDEDGTVAFDMGPISTAVARKNIDLRKLARTKESNRIF